MRKSLSAITVFHFLVIWSKYNKMRIRNGKRNYNIVYFWPILINTWVIGLIQQIKRIRKRWGYLDLELKINDLNLLWNQCSHILGKCQFYLLSLFTSGVAPSVNETAVLFSDCPCYTLHRDRLHDIDANV